ncbi:MAG: hypothetical protein IT379_30335 [Deltaproteobacteria bacterium]|nr:hypothetical protein [Deltaproteobacteria bacterium]
MDDDEEKDRSLYWAVVGISADREFEPRHHEAGQGAVNAVLGGFGSVTHVFVPDERHQREIEIEFHGRLPRDISADQLEALHDAITDRVDREFAGFAHVRSHWECRTRRQEDDYEGAEHDFETNPTRRWW